MQWEDAKRAGQTAFTDNETVKDLYKQIRTNGHILMSTGEQSLTQQIAQGIYPPSAAEPHAPQRAIDQDIEPERLQSRIERPFSAIPPRNGDERTHDHRAEKNARQKTV